MSKSPFPFAAQQMGLIARAIAGEPVQYTINGDVWFDLTQDTSDKCSALLAFAANGSLRLKPQPEGEQP